MIDITGVNLVKFVQHVYALSVPVGMGFLHATSGPLSEEEAKRHVSTDGSHVAVSMDYVKGRCCKMTVFREGGKLLMQDKWFDHSDADLATLIELINKDRGE